MSNRHPELHKNMLAEGVSYACAYMRLEHGWSLARAVSEPPHRKAPTRTLGERQAFYAAKRDKAAKKKMETRREWLAWNAKARTERRQYTPHTAEDKSPKRIQKIRAAFCEEFIRTGEINTELQAQLKGYADECRASKQHTKRVSPQHAARRFGREERPDGDNGVRDQRGVDEAAAQRIRAFLRS